MVRIPRYFSVVKFAPRFYKKKGGGVDGRVRTYNTKFHQYLSVCSQSMKRRKTNNPPFQISEQRIRVTTMNVMVMKTVTHFPHKFTNSWAAAVDSNTRRCTCTTFVSFGFNSLKPSGLSGYNQVQNLKILRSAHTVYLCVLCGSQNKQRLFPYTALTDCFV